MRRDDSARGAPRQQNGWYTQRDGERLIHARRWPPRFDIVARAEMPPMRREKLAKAIRQDVWRALQGLRGFSPVIEICATDERLEIKAGGRLDAGPAHAEAERELAALLSSPTRRLLWTRWAERAGGRP